MKDSIIINMRYSDYDCLTGQPNVERHHVLMGQMRSKADEDGLWIPLTKQHHTEGSKPQTGVRCDIHHCELLRTMSQMLAQTLVQEIGVGLVVVLVNYRHSQLVGQFPTVFQIGIARM